MITYHHETFSMDETEGIDDLDEAVSVTEELGGEEDQVSNASSLESLEYQPCREDDEGNQWKGNPHSPKRIPCPAEKGKVC